MYVKKAIPLKDGTYEFQDPCSNEFERAISKYREEYNPRTSRSVGSCRCKQPKFITLIDSPKIKIMCCICGGECILLSSLLRAIWRNHRSLRFITK